MRPVGSSAVGSSSTRARPSGSVTRRTACSWPGSRRIANLRPARHTGTPTVPAAISASSVAANRSRPGSASRWPRASWSWAADQARVRGSSASSSQR